MRQNRTLLNVGALGAAVLMLVGCSSGQQTSSGASSSGPVTGDITIAYLQKQGDQQYFIDQAAGARTAAQELSKPGASVNVKVVNLGQDANKAVTETDSAVAQKVNGIAIVVPDQKIGPQVVNTANAAGIPLVASDDSIKDGTGAEIPFVGFDGYDMGSKVGTEAAKRVTGKGWSPAETGVLYAYKQDLSVCADRVRGEKERYTAGGGQGKAIEVGTDNSVNGAQSTASGVITGNPDIKHWVVMGCNDENVSGVLQALANAKVAADNIVGVGLGGYIACKSWQPGSAPDGYLAALYIDGHDVGGDAVRALVNSLRGGTPLPPKTIARTQIVDAGTVGGTSLKCT
ncbi:substrate-binding domain-containing protein [Pseudonocardia eucalypti]|uniref:Substrate-binding domain-containing protein n=1 Tax=Pseudonocardia eucalypti TaxID=648755 RepID=A0ABP9QEB7_9PSEU|nr:L-arabinose transport system substrate-binding protein [Pseudonocardia eucalypti]